MVVALQVVLAIVAFAMVRLGSRVDEAESIESDDALKEASTRQ